MENFVTFEMAKRLKEKGFTCELPFAMYNELERKVDTYISQRVINQQTSLF